MKVIKRDGKIVDFDREKIRIAIGKANVCVEEEDRVSDIQIKKTVRRTAAAAGTWNRNPRCCGSLFVRR